MDDKTKRLVGNNLRRERWIRNWSQAFVARQLDISIRTLSRAETGCGISTRILKKLCCLYQISVAKLYEEEAVYQKKSIIEPDLVPEHVVFGLLMRNSFISDLQRETIYRYNDRIKKDAVMLREKIEDLLKDVVSNKQHYSLGELIYCCMAVNQQTIQNIVQMGLE